MQKKIAILGSTGSIGTQTLDVVARHPDRFRVVGLAAGRRIAELLEQARRFEPLFVACGSLDDVEALRGQLPEHTHVAGGAAGLALVAAESGADVVVAGTDGAVAFDAIGRALPYPTAITDSDRVPRAINAARTDCARCPGAWRRTRAAA